MNAKTHSINPSTIGLMLRRPFSAFVLVGSLSVVALFAYNDHTAKQTTFAPISAYTPSTYGLESLKLTSPTTGTAIITLDDFILNVDFDYVAVPDSYGPHGTEFTNVEVSELKEIKIKTLDGTEFSDFTNANDHQQINTMIVGYILQHHLVEGV